MSLSACLKTGAEAGATAAADCGFAARPPAPPSAEDEPVAVTPLWHVKGAGKAFVDFQNDVTVNDIALAEREGFRSVEHLKRYTTLGMATDQGKDRERHRPRDPRRACRAGRSRKSARPPTGRLTCRCARRDGRPPPRQGFPPDAAAAVASMGGGAGRGVRRNRRLAARAILSAAGREGLARDRQARGDARCVRGRRVRRLDSRQDRDRGRRRRRFSSIASTPTRSRRCRSARRATA